MGCACPYSGNFGNNHLHLKPYRMNKEKSQTNIFSNLVYELAFNAGQAMIISTTGTGDIIAANEAAANLFGLSRKTLLTRKWSALFFEKNSRAKEKIPQLLRGEHVSAFASFVKKNGCAVPCQIYTALFRDGGNGSRMITTV